MANPSLPLAAVTSAEPDVVTVVGVNVARRPYIFPLHCSVNAAGAPVPDTVSHRRGLLPNEPVTLPELIFTEELVVRHPDIRPFTGDGPVPPPVAVRRGENVMTADRRHVTCPGAGPA
jgi:hypothetical protein